MKLRSKLILALSSLIVVPFLILAFVYFMAQTGYLDIPQLRNLDLSAITITAAGKNSEELKNIIFLFLGIFIASLAMMVLVISKILSDFVIQPLTKLVKATEAVGSGQLDVQLEYNKDNEFGKLFSEFETMQEKLMATSRKQEIYEQSRKELIASITHDLKTPLTSIIGYVEGLQDGVVSNIDSYLNVIHDKSMRLNHLIDDLFTFTQLEMEQFSVDVYNISMGQVLSEYVNTKLREFESKETPIQLLVEKIDDAIIPADEFRIGQILENLINNAEKFTKTFIKIYTDVDEDYYNIYVEDDGIGIASEDLPHIFEYFYKCDKARESKKQGSGLGLAICKQLVDAHKGKIMVSSLLGEGTIFKICLRR